MKSKRSGLISLLVLVASATMLVACGAAATPTQGSQEALLTPMPILSLPTGTEPLQKATDTPTVTVQSVTLAAPGPPATPIPTDTAPPSPPPAVIQHTVQRGETLLGLALRYGVSMATIQLANGMGNSIDLVAGQTLSIPGSPQWPGERPFWVIHTVQAGETLVGLSSTYDLTVDEILRVNAISDPALIHIDQKLVMPLTQLVTLKAPLPTTTPAAVTSAQAAPSTPEPKASPATDLAAPQPSQSELPSAPAPPSSAADWPGYILARINQARAAHGLNALTIAPELTYAAQAHAEDCARRGWGSHVGSDGAVLKTRLERAGYSGRNWGENWVQALNAERAFEWWYGEIPPNDPHRRNILSPHYTEIGIGIAATSWGYIFVTDFGRR